MSRRRTTSTGLPSSNLERWRKRRRRMTFSSRWASASHCSDEPALERQLELNSVSLGHQDWGERLLLIGHMQDPAESSAAKCSGSGVSRLARGVALLAQVDQDNDRKARVMELSEELSRGPVGEVPP